MGGPRAEDDNCVVTTLPSAARTAGPRMPTVASTAVLTAVGIVALLAGCAVDFAHGDIGGIVWKVVGPLPFLAAGVLLAVRRPGWPVATWLTGVGAAFMVSVCVGDALLPALTTWPGVWTLALLRDWGSTGSALCGLGLVGLFPTGVPGRAWERWAVRVAALLAVLLPILVAVTSRAFTAGSFPGETPPVV